jgi:hypothetical protein
MQATLTTALEISIALSAIYLALALASFISRIELPEPSQDALSPAAIPIADTALAWLLDELHIEAEAIPEFSLDAIPDYDLPFDFGSDDEPTEVEPVEHLTAKTVKELQAIAKEMGIPTRTKTKRLNKTELVEAIAAA